MPDHFVFVIAYAGGEFGINCPRVHCNSSSEARAITVKPEGNFQSKFNANIFKNVFSNLTDDLLKKLPNPKNIFNLYSVKSIPFHSLVLMKEKF